MPRIASDDVFARVPVAMMVLRGNALIIEAATGEAMRLLRDRSMIGRPLSEALPQVEKQGCAQWLRDSLSTGEFRSRDDALSVFAVTGSGTVTYWSVACTPLPEKHKSPRQLVVFLDMTRHMMARRAMEDRVLAAEAANRAKDRFIATLAHELRAPLSPLLCALEVMRVQGVNTCELAIMERQAQHLTRLVSDLIDVSGLHRRRIELRKQSIWVTSVIEAAVEMVRPLLEERQHRLAIEVPTDLRVNADPDRMRQVVENLLTNAAKYSGFASEILVSAARAGNKVILSVIDQGIGIAPEVLPTLFDTPSDVHPVPSVSGRLGGGLGLGLVIVQALVREHGGEVRAYSGGLNKGSCFVVELPLLDSGNCREASLPAQGPRSCELGEAGGAVDDESVTA